MLFLTGPICTNLHHPHLCSRSHSQHYTLRYTKLTDFGVSKKMVNGLCKGNSGTAGYMAPEIYSKSHLHAEPSDFFSAGVVLHQMLTGGNLYAFDKTSVKVQPGQWGSQVGGSRWQSVAVSSSH